MDERRKSVRKHLYNYSKVFNEESNRISGRIVNLTQEGMMIMCDKPVKQNASFKFRMMLPRGINVMGEESISFDGNCRWCKKSYNPDYCDAGFEFTNVPESSMDTIEFMMRYHSFNY